MLKNASQAKATNTFEPGVRAKTPQFEQQSHREMPGKPLCRVCTPTNDPSTRVVLQGSMTVNPDAKTEITNVFL